jgi:hypothetical protein
MFVYVDETVDQLRGRTTILCEPATMPWGERVAYVTDPDDNPVALPPFRRRRDDHGGAAPTPGRRRNSVINEITLRCTTNQGPEPPASDAKRPARDRSSGHAPGGLQSHTGARPPSIVPWDSDAAPLRPGPTEPHPHTRRPTAHRCQRALTGVMHERHPARRWPFLSRCLLRVRASMGGRHARQELGHHVHKPRTSSLPAHRARVRRVGPR